GGADLDARATPLGEELGERRQVAGVARHDDLRRDARRAAVVLEEERLQDRRHVLPADVLEVERVPVDHLAAAEREDLHDRTVALGREPDHVHGAHRLSLDPLPLDQVLHRVQPVAVPRGVLESLLLGGRAHLLLQLALNRLHVAGEELDDPVDDRPVILLRDVADTGRQAALDVVVEARDPRMAPRLRALTGTVREDAVQHVERLAHLLRVRVRPEVPDTGAVALPFEHHARVLVLHRDGDVWERLVVAEADVERRAVALDEVLLEMELLYLGARDDYLDVRHALRQLADLRTAVGRALEVRSDARAKRLRLAYVQDIPLPVPEEIHARPRRQRLELILHAVRHVSATVAAALLLASAAHAGGPQMLLGATEDAVRSADPAVAQKQMDLLAGAGFDSVRITQIWAPGEA